MKNIVQTYQESFSKPGVTYLTYDSKETCRKMIASLKQLTQRDFPWQEIKNPSSLYKRLEKPPQEEIICIQNAQRFVKELNNARNHLQTGRWILVTQNNGGSKFAKEAPDLDDFVSSHLEATPENASIFSQQVKDEQSDAQGRLLVSRGEAIYQGIKEKLERENRGMVVAIEVESGNYYIASDTLKADKLASKDHPQSLFYFRSIGEE
ncbi:MAG: hypothetical protein AB1630_04135 [bacterium]